MHVLPSVPDQKQTVKARIKMRTHLKAAMDVRGSEPNEKLNHRITQCFFGQTLTSVIL